MPEQYDLVLRKASLQGRPKGKLFDIAISRGRFEEIKEHGSLKERGKEELDCMGRVLLPPFYNMHFHLDSALTMGIGGYNSSGTLWEGIRIWRKVRDGLKEQDILSRAEKVGKWMAAYGTLWLRTHADTAAKGLVTVKALLRAKEILKDILDIQVTAFPQDGIMQDSEELEHLEKAIEMGADNVGLIPHNEPTREDGVKSIEQAYSLALKYKRMIDGHIDETDDPSSRYLEVLAKKAIEYRMQGRVTAGHVTASHSWDQYYRFRIAELLFASRITIVPNPLINIYIQGRLDIYPKRRGLAPIQFFLKNNVNVALGHDCIMDPWYPLGVGDMLHALNMAVHVEQISGYEEIAKSIDLITFNAAKAWGNIENYGIEKGKKANALVANAADALDVIRLMGPPLYVVKDGRLIARNLNRLESEVLYKGRWQKLKFYS